MSTTCLEIVKLTLVVGGEGKRTEKKEKKSLRNAKTYFRELALLEFVFFTELR